MQWEVATPLFVLHDYLRMYIIYMKKLNPGQRDSEVSPSMS